MIRLISPRKKREQHEGSYRLCHTTTPAALERNEAALSLQEQIGLIEPGMQVIGSGLPIQRLGRVDLVAEDASGRTVAIMVCRVLDAREFTDALLRADWMVENVEMLEHLYGRPMPRGRVRIWIMAEAIISEINALVSRMTADRPEIFRCEAAEITGERWIMVRRVPETMRLCAVPNVEESTLRDEPKGVTSPPAPRTPSAPIRLHSVLSREEIDDFFERKEGEEEEEVTSDEEMP